MKSLKALRESINFGKFDAKDRIDVALSFSYISILFATIFLTLAFTQKNYIHVAILALLTSTLTINLIFYWKTNNPQTYIRYLSVSMSLFFIYLLITGGANDSGILWLFSFPPVVFYILGSAYGIVYFITTIIISASLIIFLGAPDYISHYSSEFIQRFIASFFVVSFVSYIHEPSREERQDKIESLNRKLEKLAFTDSLSGLHNRLSIGKILNHLLRKSQRDHVQFSLVLCDIDNFKTINDKYGHTVGDEAISMVSNTLRSSLRGNDYIARWGGEEFLILLDGVDKQKAPGIVERLRKLIQKNTIHEIQLTMSFGVTQSKADDDNTSIINRADDNMYKAKKNGKNCIVSN